MPDDDDHGGGELPPGGGGGEPPPGGGSGEPPPGGGGPPGDGGAGPDTTVINLGGQTADRNVSTSREGHVAGDPINITTGNLFQIETDYVGAGPFPLVLRRTYNSQSAVDPPGPFGPKWSHSYSAHIRQISSESVQVISADQKRLTFTFISGRWRSSPDVVSSLEPLTDANGKAIGWLYTTGLDTKETYDSAGKLLSISSRGGIQQTLEYDGQARLQSVTDPFGRKLTFWYDASNRVSSVTDPGGGVYRYAYDLNGDLITVTGPEGDFRLNTRRYLYERVPHMLTGIVDENGIPFATFNYDGQLAISSERAGGVDKVTVGYNNDLRSVTDALGTRRDYSYVKRFGVARTATATKPGSDGAVASFWFYDHNGNVDRHVDYRGHRTAFTYDLDRNLETSRTEAAGTALERTIKTEWHPAFRLPTKITEPNRVTDLDVDGAGNLRKHIITDTRTGKSRSWGFNYRDDDQIEEVHGPRTDVSDVTRYEYDNQARLKSQINALGHKTEITSYDAHGRPLTIVDPNGLTTTLEYDLRGRLRSHQIGGERTSYEYDRAGQLCQLTLPDGRSFRFTYDAAHRLIAISDNEPAPCFALAPRPLDNAIVYTLDAAGNPIKEDVYDRGKVLARTHSRAPDALNRLERSVGARGQTTRFRYDDNDNLIQLTDPLGNNARWDYDALDRLEKSTDLNEAPTEYRYDANDQLKTVIDALGFETTYDFDSLGNLTLTISPDTGRTVYIPDDAGNIVRRIDARSYATNYTYDALNRVTDLEFGEGKVKFVYDQETNDVGQRTNGLGRLTEMTDNTGITRWSYDLLGRVVRKSHHVANLTFVTRYSYDDVTGHLASITYPSGRQVEFEYTDGRITEVSAGGSTLLRDIEYEPFGPARAWVWGNETRYGREFNRDGQVRIYDLGGGRTRELIYDDAGRIKKYVDSDPRHDQAFGYDDAGALIEFTSTSGTTTLRLDPTGNRLDVSRPEGIDVYTYAPGNNQLASVTGTRPRTYEYDRAGNVTSDGVNRFEYDGRGRLMRAANVRGATQLLVNGLGQRTAKLECRDRFRDDCGGPARTGSYFVYDEAGRLLGEYDIRGRPVQETVYLDDMPVAVLMPGHRPLFVYTDHLNTPRAIADMSGKVVWRWDSDPFGATPPDEDPDGDRRRFTYNLRFPGQYFDEETGLFYNYFRDYDPHTGRYIQPDPIGLEGGINLYTYTQGDPLSFYDQYGLVELDGSSRRTKGTRRELLFDYSGQLKPLRVGTPDWRRNQPLVKYLRVVLRVAFPEIRRVGGYNPRTTERGGFSHHSEGRAIDIYVHASRPTERSVGDALFRMFIEHGPELGVEEVIWNRQIWSATRGGPRPFSPSRNPHIDHVHVGFSREGSQRLPPNLLHLLDALTMGLHGRCCLAPTHFRLEPPELLR